MYQRILIATDGTSFSKPAVRTGIELAELMGAQVVALKVVPRQPISYFEGGMAASIMDVAALEKQLAESAQVVVEAVKTSAEARGLKAKAVTVKADLIAEAIISVAKKNKCDLIVMASHGRRGMKRLLMGSETQHVLTHSQIPVLVLR